MGLVPKFGGGINQNIQQPPNAESKNYENVESNSESQKDTNNAPAKKKNLYYDEEDEQIQDVLWIDAEKKHPWVDAPPKVKVTTKKEGLCHMNIEMIVGMSPAMVYGMFTDQGSSVFDKLMKNKVVKILKGDGPSYLMKVKKDVAWRFLWWTIPIPMTLIVDEHHINHTTTYKKYKLIFLKVFKGDYKVEPIYVDAERFCKHVVPKSPEEYKKCSGGRGRLASKFTMNQYFQPYPPFDLPPFSWYIRHITVKTTETMVKKVQDMAGVIRDFT